MSKTRAVERRRGVNEPAATAIAPTGHQRVEPAILYLGTPVVLVSTLNPDGSPNLAPMSSAWWLGWTCVLGFDASSQTVANLRRTGECVLNLPSAAMAGAVDRLARTTGSPDVPWHKQVMGYDHVPDKFARAGLTAIESDTVAPPRVAECPIQLEATVARIVEIAARDPRMLVPAVSVEATVGVVHADESVRSRSYANRIDPQRWHPLIMSFLEYFDVTPSPQSPGLRAVDEETYGGRTPEPIRR
jgi:flavin reductase (DIM6/NTAB) family NADH-FMN oxidoreductase RutF